MSDPDIAAKLDGPGRKRTWLRHIDQRQHIRHVSRPERSDPRVEIVGLWEVQSITNHLNNRSRANGLPIAWSRMFRTTEQARFRLRREVNCEIGVGRWCRLRDRRKRSHVSRIMPRLSVAYRELAMRPGERVPNRIVERMLHDACPGLGCRCASDGSVS